MNTIDQLRRQSHHYVERVWKCAGEKNERGDLFEGASLSLKKSGNTIKVYVDNSGRELDTVKPDKTIPEGPFDTYRVVEVRKKGNGIDSLKVLACELPKETESGEATDNNSLLPLISAFALVTGFTGALWYFWRKR